MNVDGAREDLFDRIAAVQELSHALQRVVGEDLIAFMVSKGLSAAWINARAEQDFLKGRGLG